ncbi:MAG: ribonuclease HII [Acidobacteriota bacterium]
MARQPHLKQYPTTEFEAPYWARGIMYLAGADEVGRGAWAGPVVAAAVILNPEAIPTGLQDSKQLTPSQRKRLVPEIEAVAYSIGIGVVEAEVIDRINILEATRQAVHQALAALSPQPEVLLLDALHLPTVPIPQQSVVRGDARSVSIAAASVIAKVYRDRLMEELDTHYPVYGFARHKGYGTAYHQEQLRCYGPSPIHRLTFRGIRPGPLENKL